MRESIVRTSQPERDMRRAHWQRSVGNVLMTGLSERFLDDHIQPVTSETVASCEYRVEDLYEDYDMPLVWSRAYAISEKILAVRPGSGLITHNQTLHDQSTNHTVNKHMDRVFDEGLESQTIFPLNMARIVSREAAERNIDGFATDSLTDIAQVLRRPDFKELMYTSALTKNGVWGSFATNPRDAYKQFPGRPELDVDFTDGQVAYSPGFGRYLRSELSRVNQDGQSEGRHIMGRASSGCPVRHERAHFTGSSDDRRNLQILSAYFDKPTEELLAPREQPIIGRFLDVQADILEQADDIYTHSNISQS